MRVCTYDYDHTWIWMWNVKLNYYWKWKEDIYLVFLLWINYFDTLMMYLFMLTLKPSRSKKIFVLEHVSIVNLNLDHVVVILPSEANMISVIQCSIRTWWSAASVPWRNPHLWARWGCHHWTKTILRPCIAPWYEYQYWSRMTISSPQDQDWR